MSPLGVLGERAFKGTNNGNPVDDMTLVDIIVHEIKLVCVLLLSV